MRCHIIPLGVHHLIVKGVGIFVKKMFLNLTPKMLDSFCIGEKMLCVNEKKNVNIAGQTTRSPKLLNGTIFVLLIAKMKEFMAWNKTDIQDNAHTI